MDRRNTFGQVYRRQSRWKELHISSIPRHRRRFLYCHHRSLCIQALLTQGVDASNIGWIESMLSSEFGITIAPVDALDYKAPLILVDKQGSS